MHFIGVKNLLEGIWAKYWKRRYRQGEGARKSWKAEETGNAKTNQSPSSHGNGSGLSHVRRAVTGFEVKGKHGSVCPFIGYSTVENIDRRGESRTILGNLLSWSEFFPV